MRHPRPPHPEPYVRDDRETPLCVGRDDETMEVIWVKREGAIFLREGLDNESVICPTRLGKYSWRLWSGRTLFLRLLRRTMVMESSDHQGRD